MWKIEKLISKGDYIYALVPNHPNATKNGYVLYHRIVVENHIGRLLTSDEIVHHKDGNKRNNNIDNLEITTISNHAKYHMLERGRIYAKIKCPNCETIYVKRKRDCIDKRQYCCSRKCGRAFQLMSIDKRRQRLKEAVIEIFKAKVGDIGIRN